MHFETATYHDLEAIAKLLADNNLPLAGIESAHIRFMVMRDGDAIIAAAAIEGDAPDGLLRSVVVDRAYQQQGLGATLIDRVISEAKEKGYNSLYLLTETASPFFAQLGFEIISREEAPTTIQASGEFENLCPTSATCMTLLLSSYKSKHYAKR